MNDRVALRPKEAAEALGVSVRTLYTLTKSGAIRAVKLGAAKQATVLYPVAELERFLCERSAGK